MVLHAHDLPDFIDRFDHRKINLLIGDTPDKHAVDLQVVDRQLFQVGERRQAAAEIVQRKPATQKFERFDKALGRAEVGYGGRPP